MRPIALQLWTIRDALAADAEQALARVKASGYSAVEIAPLSPDMTPQRLGALLQKFELSVVSIHADLPSTSNLELLLSLAQHCRCSKAIWHGWPRDDRFDSLDGIKSLIADYQQAGEIARDHGLAFGLHNHWWEFEPVAGQFPYRVFHEALPSDIFWQLDVYWAQTAGVDPADILTELGPRLQSLHLKDGPAVHGPPMTPLGEGVIDFPRLFGRVTQPVDWIVELDSCATDPFDAAQQSLEYLKRWHT